MRVAVGPTPANRRVMIFIDGGYLRGELKERYRTEKDEFTIESFEKLIRNKLLPNVPIRGEHIRTYYYDATIDDSTIKKVEDEKERERLREKMEKQWLFSNYSIICLSVM